MVMTSQQIGNLASGQQAMFGQFQSYAQQITPPYASQPGGMMGNPMSGYQSAPPAYTSGPPPAPPPMPAWQPHMTPYQGGMASMAMQLPNAMAGSGAGQVFGERMMGGMLGAANTGLGVAGTAFGIAPLLGMGASALGMGGGAIGALGALGGPIGMPIAAGIAAAGYGANQMMTGFQQRQGVNRVLRSNFGGVRGIGSGRGGMGFSSSEMGGISTMLREMGTEDMFSSMEELTGLMDQTAKMGAFRGVRSAQEFKQRFRQTVDSLREIAQTMNTTLGEAVEFMGQSRQMGFFSGQDISRNLMSTRMGAAATGMSVGQMQQIGQMGSQMGMAFGWRGRTGAQAAQNIATNIGAASRSGALSEEQLFEATGGLQGPEAVQALTSRMMQVNERFLSRGAGRVLTAAMWDPESGGVNREMMERIQRGEISFQEARRIGRRNIRQTGGRRSEFFAQEERIRGEAMEAGGFDLTMGMLESHLRRRGRDVDLDDPIAQRFLRRRMGMNQSEVEAFVQMRREMPRIMSERRQAMRGEMNQMLQSRRREGAGLQGVRRRWSQWWEREIENPMRQTADDLTTRISQGIEELMNEFEGRIQTHVSDQTKSMFQEWARTGERPSGLMGAKELASFTRQAQTRGLTMETGGLRGMARGLGIAAGIRGGDMYSQLRAAKAGQHGLRANASNEERQEFLNRMQRDLSMTYQEQGFTSKEMKDLGSRALETVYSSMSTSERQSFLANRSNKDKAYAMAKKRIELLRQKDERLKAYFDKALGTGDERTWYRAYGALANLEREAGLGDLAIDTGALAGGGGDALYGQGIRGARQMQEESLKEYLALTGSVEGKEAAAAGWGEKITRGVLGVATFGGSEVALGIQRGVFGGDLSQLAFGRTGVEGEGVDFATGQRLLKNDRLRADLAAARRGDKDALERLTKASVGGGSDYEIREKDERHLRTILDTVRGGTEKEKAALDRHLRYVVATEQMVVQKRVKNEAAKTRRFVEAHGEVLREGMGEAAFELYDEILSSQEQGKINEAVGLAKQFFEKYGGTEKGNFLLAQLRKGGISHDMQEGLSTMADYTSLFRGDKKQKARRLIEMTLGQTAGVRSQRELRKLLSPSFMRKVRAGKIGPEELAQQLVENLTDEQRAGLAERGVTTGELVQKLSERIEVGEKGVTAEELRKTISGQAANNQWGALIDGAPEEEMSADAKSLKELQSLHVTMKAILMQQAGSEDIKALMSEVRKSKAFGDGEADE